MYKNKRKNYTRGLSTPQKSPLSPRAPFLARLQLAISIAHIAVTTNLAGAVGALAAITAWVYLGKPECLDIGEHKNGSLQRICQTDRCKQVYLVW